MSLRRPYCLLALRPLLCTLLPSSLLSPHPSLLLLALAAVLIPALSWAGPDAGVVGITAPAVEIAPGPMQPRVRIANFGGSSDTITTFFSIERPGGGLYESFTDSLVWPPANWQVLDVDGGSSPWARDSSFPLTPPGHAVCRREVSLLDNDDWLITPRVRVTSRDTLYFWFRALGPQMESLRVRVSLGDSSPASFVHLLQAFDFNNSIYLPGWADFSRIGDTSVYIAFQYRMRSGQAGTGICLDDIILRTAYLADSARTLVLPGDSATLNFVSWNARLGHYVARCSVWQPGDTWPANNSAELPFEVKEPPPSPSRWTEVRPMPLAPSNKDVKRGGWLAACQASGLVYAAKGQKSGDFYSYNPVTDSWAQLLGLGQGTPGPNETDKGGRGVCAGSRVYVVLGNNTHWFLCYDIPSGTWSALDRVPAGPSGKNVKGGSDLVYVPATDSGQDCLYLLKGELTEFYRYDIAAGRWQQLENAPAGAKPKYKYGSWLAHVGGRVYCHKAGQHEFYVFDLATQKWSTTPLPALPLYNSAGRKKKAKDGSGAAVWDGRVYALKGGNTGEFWVFDPATNAWTEKDTIPAFGTAGRKKRVNHGGDVCLDPSGTPGRFFALKGNKTRELWVCTVAETTTAASGRPLGYNPNSSSNSGLCPHPPSLFGCDRVIVHLPSSLINRHAGPRDPVRISIYDASGRLVRHSSTHWNASSPLDLGSMPPGVYLLRFSIAGHTATRKLVLRR
ncbi:T9SS type A sorting domain-containing protein [candidate division WOR-3 bacterium]|nr:T9SS type A sorting domain-containing protein [candidate division WOR-3 bacterium]